MRTQSNRHGKREAGSGPSLMGRLGQYWGRYRAWVAGLNRGQKIRYRLLQAATVIAIIIIAAYLALSAWIRLPEVPNLPGTTPGGTQTSNEGMFEDAELPNVAKSGRKPGYYTFLVAGQDVVSGGTDTILLFTFDTQNKTLNAVSILRDTMINTSASSKRINSVYARNRGSSDLPEAERVENGMAALKQEVSKLTGIYPDFYVLVQWEAIGELVDALGGVYFDVPFDMDYDDPYQDLHIHQEAGYRKLNGDDAMQVVRWRKNNTGPSGGDVARTAVQQAFLGAVLDTCLQPAVLLKLPSLAQVFLDNVTTDLSIGNLLAFAQLAVGMDTEEDVNFTTMPYTGVYYRGASMVVANEDELLELLNSGLNPYLDDIQSSDLQLMYKKSDGGFGVTNATLADERMGRVTVTQPQPDEEEKPDTGDTSQNGGDTSQDSGDSSAQGGDTSQGSGDSSGQGGDTSQGSGDSSAQGGDTSQGGGDSSGQGGDTSQGGGDSSGQGGDTSQGSGDSSGQDGDTSQGSGDSSGQGGDTSQSSGDSASQGGGADGSVVQGSDTGSAQGDSDTASQNSYAAKDGGLGHIDPDLVLPDPAELAA